VASASSPRWQEQAAIEDSHRMFNCAGCHRQVVICRRCDRGQRYCSATCSRTGRRQSIREAGQRYQQSPLGARNNAVRQKRWRLQFPTTVTHHTSAARVPVREGPAVPGHGAGQEARHVRSSHRLAVPVGGVQEAERRCDFCGSPCGRYTRLGTLAAGRYGGGWRLCRRR
jgi:hypothetical protein